MTPGNRTIWQLAGGPALWSYAEVFLKYGVGLIGPGDPGPWNQQRGDDEFQGGFVRRFAGEMKEGDIVLLRKGISTVTAIGLVAGNYQYLEQFSDVNGCDLQHTRRIRWCPHFQEYSFGTSVFGGLPSRCSRTSNQKVIDFAKRFINSPPRDWQEAGLPDLPEVDAELNLIPPSIEPLVAQVHDLIDLYWDNKNFGDVPTEDELISHLVIPFFRALGWQTELIAVKWRNIDIALFTCLPRIPENCRFIVEAKRISQGAEGALEQAMGYAKHLGVPCDIIVTDGLRYRLYLCEKGFAPVAYANLNRLKQSSAKLFQLLRRP
ncbi:MAG: hypothetical protein AB2L11_13615 [Syntrophobacteraceae bacterium]